MTIQPYLHFNGNCAEALDFYKKALGAQVTMSMKFRDCPVPMDPNCVKPEMLDQVMHAEVRIGDTTIFASDCGKALQGFSLTYNVKTPAEAERIFNSLTEGGQVVQPLSETFFAHSFGMVNDRFGVQWMVIIPKEMSIPESRGTAA